ncbi:inositol monophosphatase [Pseudonocardiaceae bacterium YIM PH 21723]|nr:inositol monophosphatase [Pseudonocardiaceae bacterium YIM PH 21723]
MATRVPSEITEKARRDLVTDVDLAVEETMRAFLTREAPEIGVLGEELGLTGPSGQGYWALDPVDGTANFARGIPLCGVSLGLIVDEQPVVGAIELPLLGHAYWASVGGGAFRDGQRLQVSTVDSLASSMVSVGDFSVRAEDARKNELRLRLLAALGAQAERVRMIGTAAIDMVWVAEGKLEATINLSNLPWDTMAGVVLVREAGGLVVDGDGTRHGIGSACTIAVTPGIHDILLDLINH